MDGVATVVGAVHELIATSRIRRVGWRGRSRRGIALQHAARVVVAQKSNAGGQTMDDQVGRDVDSGSALRRRGKGGAGEGGQGRDGGGFSIGAQGD